MQYYNSNVICECDLYVMLTCCALCLVLVCARVVVRKYCKLVVSVSDE
jgi:hypothetical protein